MVRLQRGRGGAVIFLDEEGPYPDEEVLMEGELGERRRLEDEADAAEGSLPGEAFTERRRCSGEADPQRGGGDPENPQSQEEKGRGGAVVLHV